MNRLKLIALAIICSLFLLGMASNSNAQINIIEMYTPPETYTGLFYPYAYVDTDKPFDAVDWSIGDPDDGDNLSGRKSISGDGVTTRAYFFPDVSDCPGHIKGKKYRVAARVWYTDDDGNGWSDYETRDFTVFKSMFTTEVEDPPKIARNVYGYSELTRQYYTGSAIKIDCYVYAYNPFETRIYAWSRFKHSLTGRHTIERDHPNPNGVEPQRIGGKYGSYSHQDTLTHKNINLERGGSYKSGAYVRLIVQSRAEDHYLIENTGVEFNKNDKPYDAPD